MKNRALFSLAICLLVFPWLTVKWHIVATYYGWDNSEFILTGFPFPYAVESGIVGRFGNSMETALNYFNLIIDLLFYWAIFLGFSYWMRNLFPKPSKELRVIAWLLLSIGLIFNAVYFYVLISEAKHPWFESGYEILYIEFL